MAHLESGTDSRLREHIDHCRDCAARFSRISKVRTHIAELREAAAPELPWTRIETQMNWKLAAHAAPTRRWLWPVAAASLASLAAVGFFAMRWTTRPSDSAPTAARVAPSLSPEPVVSAEGFPTLIEGIVDVVREGQKHRLTMETRIVPGDRLVSRVGARAVIQTSAGTAFSVETDSTVDVRGLDRVWHELLLVGGQAFSRVESRRLGERYAVLSGPYEIRVRGTRFAVLRDQAAATTDVELYEGIVEVLRLGSADPPIKLVAAASKRFTDDGTMSHREIASREAAMPVMHWPFGPMGRLVIPEPPGTQVTIDGQWMGHAPLTFRAALGSHVVRFERPGFDAWETTVDLTSEHPHRIVPSLTSSALPRERLRQVTDAMRRHSHELRACYERHLKRGAQSARAELTLDIETDGRISGVDLRGGFDEPSVSACIRRSVSRWQLGPGREANIAVPISFLAAE